MDSQGGVSGKSWYNNYYILQNASEQPQPEMREEEVDALFAEIDGWMYPAPEDALIAEIDDILEKIKKPQASILKPNLDSEFDLILKELINNDMIEMKRKLNKIWTEYKNGQVEKAENFLDAYLQYLQNTYDYKNQDFADILQDIKNSESNLEELRDNLKELRRFSVAEIHRFYQSYPRAF